MFSLSSTCFLIQDGRVSNCSPYHVISIQPLFLIFMDDHQFERHALSLYRFYRERGCLVTFQLWTTEDGGEHFKISCHASPPYPFRQPTLPFRPPTKLFPSGIPPFPRKTRRAPKKSFAQAVSQSHITAGNKSSSLPSNSSSIEPPFALNPVTESHKTGTHGGASLVPVKFSMLALTTLLYLSKFSVLSP